MIKTFLKSHCGLFRERVDSSPYNIEHKDHLKLQDVKILTNIVTQANRDKNEILIFGDANCSKIQWKEAGNERNIHFVLPERPRRIRFKYNFIDNIMRLGLVQICNFTNQNDNVLDLIFTNISNDYNLIRLETALIKNVKPDHHPIRLEYLMQNLSISDENINELKK
uniref:CSON008014 protein n=1 Tax=Culicoides sonorensis TaxID=179676 RepID=A0A336KCL1_CULSO